MSDPLFFVDVVFTEQPAALESVGLSFPDAILTQTNLTGVVSAIANDPDTDVGTWLTAASATAATDLRVSFPTPAANPYLAQNFRYLLRKTAGTPDPTVTAELRQANVLRKTIATGTAVTSTTGQVIQGDWSSTDLIGTVDGSDVELRLVSVPGQSSAPGALPAMNATAGTLSSSATLAGTRSLTIPTHTSGDLLVLVVGMFNTNLNQSFTSIGTAGWTQAGGVGWEYGVGTSAAVGFGWKIGNGLETTVSVTVAGGTGTDRFLGRVYRFTATNGFATPPIQNIGTQVTSASSTSMGMPSVTRVTTNDLALAVCAAYNSATMAAATGETGGNWTEVVGESAATNGTIGLQISSFTGATISGGTSTLSLASIKTTIGCSIVPASVLTNTNTVEVGAIEWNVAFMTFVAASLDGVAMLPRSVSPSLDGVAALLGVKTASADSVVRAVRSVAPGADVAVLGNRLAPVSLDGAAQRLALSQAVAADGAVGKLLSVTPLADGAASKPMSATTSLNAAVQATGYQNPLADAAVQISRAPIDTHVDGAVSTPITATCTANSGVAIARTVAPSADAAILGNRTLSASLDGAAAQATTLQASANAAVLSRISVTPLCDVAAQRQIDQTVKVLSADSVVSKTISDVPSCDAAIRKQITLETFLDVYAFSPTAHSIVTSSDAAIIANIIASSELDVSAKSTFSTIASLDSSAQKVFSCNATANGVVSIPNTASALSDTIVKASLNVSPSLDSALSSSRTISVATDVFVREAATAQTLLNVAVQSEASASVGMDGVCADAAEAFTAFTNADAVTAIQRGVTCNVGVVVAPGPPIGNFVVRSLPEIRTIYAPADVLLDAYVIASISENRVVKGARPRIGV